MKIRKFSVALLRSFDVMGGEVYIGVQEVAQGEATNTYGICLGGASDVALALSMAFDDYTFKCMDAGISPEPIVSMIISEVTNV